MRIPSAIRAVDADFFFLFEKSGMQSMPYANWA
jgi:hypothetical protein